MIETHVVVLVLVAAALHASWNALVKGAADKVIGMAAVVLGHVPFALVALLFVPLPDAAALPYILGGATLHVGYQFFLIWAYRHGDLTQVYPIARGVAPLLVAGVSVVFLHERLTAMQTVAILAIGCGIMSLVLVRGEQGLSNTRGAALALATGCFIAAYSMVDGYGARVAGTAVGFYACESLLNAALFTGYLLLRAPRTLAVTLRRHVPLTLAGGGASFVAYALVVWAFTQAPIAVVTALRETSIIFALLIGVLVMHERLDLRRLASVMVTLMGAVLLRFAR